MVEHIYVEFALMGQSRKCEVAGTKKAGDGVVRVWAEAKIELCMERMAQEELHDDFARLELG